MLFLLSSTIRTKLQRSLVIGAMVIILFFLEALNITQPITNLGQSAITPVLQFNVRLASSFYQFFYQLRGWQSTARRVQDLEIKLAHTSAQLSELEFLQKENQQLREMVGSVDRDSDKVIISRPILSMAQPAVGLPIGKDSDLEVRPGLAVLAENTLVGVVTSVKSNAAYIGLLWQKDMPLVLAQTQDGVQGILTGDGRRVLLTEIPVDQEIEIGERVITTGQEGIAQGLYVGEIRSIRSGHSSAVKTAVIEQYVSFYEVSLVEIRI
jgi:cell shape-determining protein MreC